MKHEYELCKGRHVTPAENSIFGEIVNPTDVEGLYNIAASVIPADTDELVIYVTGLTVAMLAVVRVCLERGIRLTAMHYDRESGVYYPQLVVG